MASLRIIIRIFARDQKGAIYSQLSNPTVSMRDIYSECSTTQGHYVREVRSQLKSKVQKLAKQKNGLVGLMAVAAFEGLRERGE